MTALSVSNISRHDAKTKKKFWYSETSISVEAFVYKFCPFFC
jgi:hypothetical protein